MKTISGAEAIARMRQIRHDPSAHFVLHHLTYNHAKDSTNGLRVVNKARIRPGLPTDVFQFNSELYLTYYDIEKDDARMCFKKLIRFVGFAPDYELLKVDWFKV
jgi:hypothetical protein